MWFIQHSYTPPRISHTWWLPFLSSKSEEIELNIYYSCLSTKYYRRSSLNPLVVFKFAYKGMRMVHSWFILLSFVILLLKCMNEDLSYCHYMRDYVVSILITLVCGLND